MAAQSSSCKGQAHRGGLPGLLHAPVSDAQPPVGVNASHVPSVSLLSWLQAEQATSLRSCQLKAGSQSAAQWEQQARQGLLAGEAQPLQQSRPCPR